MSAADTPVVDVAGLCVELADGSRLVDDVAFGLRPAEVLGLVGESGSGKSTLSLAMLGHARRGARITAGSVRIEGTDVLSLRGQPLRTARRDLVAYVPQDPAVSLNPTIRIRTQLRERLSGSSAEIDERIRTVLAAVALPDDKAFLRKFPRELSGGQQQRVALAMAVLARPRLAVLDEPTTGLDVTTQSRVLELVAQLCRDNDMAAIYVSHDIAVIAEVADRVAVMYAGQIVEQGRCADVVQRPTHPYTRALLSAVPSTQRRLRLQAIPGRAPAPRPPREACNFAPRCEFATDECRSTAPVPEPIDGKDFVRCLRARELSTVSVVPATLAPVDASETVDEDATLSVRGLDAGYGDYQVLFDVTFSAAAGQCLAVVGESGSGKTTMAQCLVGLQQRWAGDVRLAGAPLAPAASKRSKQQRREVQYVFQNPYASLNPRRTVGDSVGVPLEHFFGMGTRERRARVGEALERVELPASSATRYPAELSGGQRQRAAIARALACAPTLLVCDEVTSALDVSVQASIVELLRSLLAEGLTMLFVTHNLAVVRSIADTVVVLNQGVVVEHGVATDVLDDPQHPYTRSLLHDTLDVPAAASA